MYSFVFLLCIGLVYSYHEDKLSSYTEFERTMIINQREIIGRLNLLEPTVRRCRESPSIPYKFDEIDITDKKGRLPDFEHNMIHYQRTIMSQLNRVKSDADNCRLNEFLGRKEETIKHPNTKNITCESHQIVFENSCLEFQFKPMTWVQAETECRNTQGGHLAEPKNIEKFITITTEERKKHFNLSRSIWIGANGKAYTRAPGQGLLSVYGINCPTVHFFPGGGDKMSDFPCKYQRSFICQKHSKH